MKLNWQKAILMLVLVLYPMIAGCLTDVPFNVKTGNFNLTLKDIDTYQEVKAIIPEEALFPGSIIDNAIVEYKIENLSDVDASITFYAGAERGLMEKGTQLITQTVAANSTLEGTFTAREIINAISSGNLYLGAKCEQNANIAIIFNVRISGSYNIASSLTSQ